MYKFLETTNPKKICHFNSSLNKCKYKIRVDDLPQSGVKFMIKKHERKINS